MDKRARFELRFVGKAEEDWEMVLHTSEPVTEEEITNLIEIHSEILHDGGNDYSPVDILDRICDEKGWRWEDAGLDQVVIQEW